MDRWLREIVSAKATAASYAMDAEYIRTHIGGGWHRLFDGGHDLFGAWKAVRDTAPEDRFLLQLNIYASELWKDLATPNGLPVFTWNKHTFDAVADALQRLLEVSPDWVRDMASFTATEVGGGIVALAAIFMNFRCKDPERYFELCGSVGASSLVSANPVLLAVWVAFLLRGAFQRQALMRWESSLPVLRGAIVSMVGIACVTLLGPVGLFVAVPAMIAARLALKRLMRGRQRLLARAAIVALTSEIRAQIAATPAPLPLSGLPPWGWRVC